MSRLYKGPLEINNTNSTIEKWANIRQINHERNYEWLIKILKDI